MNSAEQTVTWLIALGVLESPKKTISDPEGFLQSSLKDGVVLCRLLDRLLPGTIDKVSARFPPLRRPAALCAAGPAAPGRGLVRRGSPRVACARAGGRGSPRPRGGEGRGGAGGVSPGRACAPGGPGRERRAAMGSLAGKGFPI